MLKINYATLPSISLPSTYSKEMKTLIYKDCVTIHTVQNQEQSKCQLVNRSANGGQFILWNAA